MPSSGAYADRRSGGLCRDPGADGGDAEHRLWNRSGEQRSFLRRHAVRVLESSHLGWIGIIVGIIQLTGGFSLYSGGEYGRFIGIFAATLGAIEPRFAIGGPHPWRALGSSPSACGSSTA
jgi:hypothetical protein